MIPKRSDYQLAYEAQQFQQHMYLVRDHTKCSLAAPCRQPSIKKVVDTTSLRRPL